MTIKKKKKSEPPEFPCAIETFRHPGAWERSNLMSANPSCFNGVVKFRRYRVTFEEIKEPTKVLADRIRKLWRESDNHHDWSPLKAAASSLGIELDHAELGKDKKKR